jgi:hypothetical protein
VKPVKTQAEREMNLKLTCNSAAKDKILKILPKSKNDVISFRNDNSLFLHKAVN